MLPADISASSLTGKHPRKLKELILLSFSGYLGVDFHASIQTGH